MAQTAPQPCVIIDGAVGAQHEVEGLGKTQLPAFVSTVSTATTSSLPSTKSTRSTRSTQSLSKARASMLKTWLLEEGFITCTDPKAGHFGRTYYPLHKAVKQNSVELVETLLRAGADPSCKNSSGLTPLESARRHNWLGSSSAVIAALESFLSEHDEEVSHQAFGASGGA